MVALNLSANAPDKRSNDSPKNFISKICPTADYTSADPLEFAGDIKSTGFFRNKAKNILATAKSSETISGSGSQSDAGTISSSRSGPQNRQYHFGECFQYKYRYRG